MRFMVLTVVKDANCTRNCGVRSAGSVRSAIRQTAAPTARSKNSRGNHIKYIETQMEARQNALGIRDIKCKVPQVTLAFWIIKCCATTVGETLSDYFAETLGLGLGIAAIIFFPCLAVLLACQFYADKYIPAFYWLTVVFMSICGTIATDGLHDDLGLELWIEVIVFGFLVLCNFYAWYRSEGTLDIHSVKTLKREAYFWLTVLLTFALGTAVGDGVSEAANVGYGFTLLIFAGALIFIACLWALKIMDPINNFWFAYIMTRPFGAACGDLLAQTKSSGSAGLGTATTSLIFSLIIVLNVAYLTYTGVDIDPGDAIEQEVVPQEDECELATTKKVVVTSAEDCAVNA